MNEEIMNSERNDPQWYGSLFDWMRDNSAVISRPIEKLLEREVSLQPQEIEKYQSGTIEDLFPAGPLLVTADFAGFAIGPWYFLFPRDLCAVIADLILTGKADAEFDESAHPDTLGEAWGKVMNLWAEVLTGMSDQKVTASKPEVAMDPSAFLKIMNSWPVVRWDVSIENTDNSFFLQAINPEIEKYLTTIPADENILENKIENSDQMTDNITDKSDVPIAQPAKFEDFGETSETVSDADQPRNMDMLLDINLPITIELGRTTMLIREVLELGPGSVIELDKLSGEPVDLYVNDRKFAKGEVVVIDENFGVRITELIGVDERIKGLK